MQRSLALLVPALVLAVASASGPGVALGQAAAFAPLTWDAPTGCPSVDELWARIDDLQPDALVVSPIAVRVVASAEGHIATVRVGDAEREVRARTCDVAASAVALVIATALMTPAPPSLSETAELADASSSPLEEADAPLDGPIEEEDEVEPEVRNRRAVEGLRGTASASVSVAFGPLPGARPVTNVRIGLRTGGFEIDVGWFHTTTLPEDRVDAGGALIRLGWVLGVLPFELAFQVAGQVGAVWEARSNAAASAIWGAVGAGLEGRYWWDQLGFSIYGDMLLPVSRYTAPLLGERWADELPAITIRLGAGILFQFD